MYPFIFFGLFPAFPRDWRAFVAMSFEDRFTPRWENVLKPALGGVKIGGRNLEPHRVNLTMSGDSIITNILDEISRCRVLVADITTLHVIDRIPLRSQNVFYEVGLAHAVRLPEEVILFRSDDDKLAFDIANVRVHHYDPEGKPAEARQLVAEKVEGSLKELDLRKNLAVRRAAQQLDFEGWMILVDAHPGMSPPARRTVGQALGAGAKIDAIARLLELGALETEFTPLTAELLDQPYENLVRYKLSPFGRALFDYIWNHVGGNTPEVRERLAQIKAEGAAGATAGPPASTA